MAAWLFVFNCVMLQIGLKCIICICVVGFFFSGEALDEDVGYSGMKISKMVAKHSLRRDGYFPLTN